MRIPALTIWQPWASLIVAGCKPYEFRGWRPPPHLVGRRIAIHAAARPIRKAEVAEWLLRLRGPDAWSAAMPREAAIALLEKVHASPGMLPLGAVLGTARLGEPRRGSEVVAEFGGPPPNAARDGHSNWGWPLTDVERFEPPVPTRGAQGFWTWDSSRS
jgi:ASCH domain